MKIDTLPASTLSLLLKKRKVELIALLPTTDCGPRCIHFVQTSIIILVKQALFIGNHQWCYLLRLLFLFRTIVPNRLIQNLLPLPKKYEFSARAGNAPSMTRLVLPLLLRWVQDVCLLTEVSRARIYQACIFLHYFGPGSTVLHPKRAVKVDNRRALSVLHLGTGCSWGGPRVHHLWKIRLQWEVNGSVFDHELILDVVTLVIQLSALVFIPDILYSAEQTQLLHAWVLCLL